MTIFLFEIVENDISSRNHTLVSDDVLRYLRPELESIGYLVEKSKSTEDKIRVPVSFGRQGKTELAFEVDAYHQLNKTVVEVEAGRGVTNYQFLKDYYESIQLFQCNVRK